MHGASKIVIIIPLVVLALAVFFQLQQKVSVLNKKTAVSSTLPTSILPSLSPTPVNVKINLKGPFICNYQDKESSVSAQIKNGNAYIQLMRDHGENILLNGDCVYKWEPNRTTGDKMCGISNYLFLYETMSAVGGEMDIGSLLGLLQLSDKKDETLNAEYIQKVVNTCKKQEVKDSIFTIPSRVSFKETKVEDPSGGMFNLPFGL